MKSKALVSNPMVAIEQFFEQLHNQPAKDMVYSGTIYPPYNILKTGDLTHQIEIAVVGFTRDNLSITQEGRELKVVGTADNPHNEKDLLCHGIAFRDFARSFILADDTEVDGVELENGILTIRLKTIVPEEKKPKVFDIGGTKAEFLQE